MKHSKNLWYYFGIAVILLGIAGIISFAIFDSPGRAGMIAKSVIVLCIGISFFTKGYRDKKLSANQNQESPESASPDKPSIN